MTTASALPTALLPPRLLDRSVVVIALALFAAGVLRIGIGESPAKAAVFLIGGLLGITLYHAAFGFTGGWRAFVTEGRGAGLRAQMVMLAVATVIFLPLLSLSAANDWGMNGFVVPISTMMVVGAVLFGIGMQLGGGCGSGTLFTVGGGSARMLITLAFFIVGSMVGVVHAPAWSSLPSFGSFKIADGFGVMPAIVLQLAVIGLLYWLIARSEAARRGKLDLLGVDTQPSPSRLLRGPWPIIWGAVLLALLNALFLTTAGHPWGITSAFHFWGAKIANGVGLPVEAWAGRPGAFGNLDNSVFSHTISVSDFGLILGAMLAAGLAGKFAPKVDLSARSVIAAVLGGLLMGYGARLSSGCNIGALFSGIASGSLHGWIWFAAAFAGSMLGIRGRKLLGI